jgi:hypothetical protein
VVVSSAGLTLLWAARRRLPLWGALPIALAGGGILTATEHDDVLTAAVMAMVAVWALVAINPSRPPWVGVRTFPAASGATAGLISLVRPSAGLAILAVFVVTCAVAFPSRRLLAIAALTAAFGVTALVLGLIAGQSPRGLVDYALRSAEFLLHYADGQAHEEGPGSDYLLATVALILIAMLAWWSTAGWPALPRMAAYIVSGLILFAGFKQSFMRHDPVHAPYYFVCALGLGFGFAAVQRGRTGLVAACLMGLLGLCFAVAGVGQALHPGKSLAELRDDVRMLSSSTQQIAAERRVLRRKARLDFRIAQALNGKTVHVWPTQTAVVWGYPAMRWRPLPVFQPQAAFSAGLDHENARVLSSPSAPQRILRARKDAPTALSPATRLSLFCHYRQLETMGRWQVLTRAANRCGRSRMLASVRTTTGRPVSVPRPPGANQIIVARFRGLGPSVAERIQAFFFKGIRWTLSAGRSAPPANLAEGVAGGPFVLAVPSTLDYPPPFRIAANPDSLVIAAVDPTDGEITRRLTIDFLALQVHQR